MPFPNQLTPPTSDPEATVKEATTDGGAKSDIKAKINDVAKGKPTPQKFLDTANTATKQKDGKHWGMPNMPSVPRVWGK